MVFIWQVSSNVGDAHRSSRNVTMDSPLCEPLCYPLLFPHGENGWGQHLASMLSFKDYITSRILMPEATSITECHDGDHILKMRNKNGTRMVSTNRFQLLARLKSYYLVEHFSRCVENYF